MNKRQIAMNEMLEKARVEINILHGYVREHEKRLDKMSVHYGNRLDALRNGVLSLMQEIARSKRYKTKRNQRKK